MDQLKKQLAGVLVYGFWIGCVVVLLGSLGVWWMSTGTLDQENVSRVGKIKGDIKKVTALKGEMADQPNEESHKQMRVMIERRKKQVLAAWQQIYNAQSKILTWPETLKAEYVDEFKFVRDAESNLLNKNKKRLPFESFTAYPPEKHQKAPLYIRQGYRYYIDQELPEIATIAKAEWTAKFDTKAGAQGRSAMMLGKARDENASITGVEQGPVVAWSSASQESVLADLFPWRGRVPNTLEIYYSQENIWVLKQLLQIIAEVNGEARQPFEAKIREIAMLGIGKSVRLGAGSIASPSSVAQAGMEYEMEMEMEMSMGSDSMEMGGGMVVEEVDPGDNRYLNIEDKHISGADLRGALSSNSPGDAPLAVAKRVPVKIVVKMDQRYVPQLLAACGSAPLMVEVKQTRVLPKDTQVRTGGGGGEEGEGRGEPEMDEAEGEGGMGPSMGGMPAKTKDEFPLDMTVEVYGLIYLYNPPNEEALGIEQVTEEIVDAIEAGENVPSTPDDALPAPADGDPQTPPAATDPAAPEVPAVDPAAADPAPAPDPNVAGPAAITSPLTNP